MTNDIVKRLFDESEYNISYFADAMFSDEDYYSFAVMSGHRITYGAAKYINKLLVERFKKKEDISTIRPIDIVNELNLWMVDEWTHVGYCILTCLENLKLVESYNKGNLKVFEALVGKTIKAANMTVDPELIRELMPLIIKAYWSVPAISNQ